MKLIAIRARPQQAFTLIELIVSIGVVSILLLVLLSITTQTGSVIERTSGKLEQFRDARAAFESMTRNISQSTLNTYWDYDDPANPSRYVRQSELRFISGDMTSLAGMAPGNKQWLTHAIFFQAPLGFSDVTTPGGTQPDGRGLTDLLNTWGYFIEYGDDQEFRPEIVKTPPVKRFRLLEFMQPANDNSIYLYTSGTNAANKPKSVSYVGKEWFTDGLFSPERPVHVLAENVIALIILPKLSSSDDPTGIKLAPSYSYDSTNTSTDPLINPRNQLPPVVQITLIAIDEVSAKRMTDTDIANLQNHIDGLFLDAADYTNNLEPSSSGGSASLADFLIQKNINYRIFTTSVVIKGAKWSREQVN